MASYYRRLIDLLREHGRQLDRQARGSQEIWRNLQTGAKVTVPFDCEKRHTANGILKDAGINFKF